MGECPSCGHGNQPGARFCSACGVALVAAADPVHEERKVVTVLFADLVGFTSRAEQMDPEDVRALLSPYYARLRVELEHFGGTVEKFIGDAVMALFGAPAAHEDDPERAVRAALAIRDWARTDERIQVRIGVNTGEALVALGARPSAGEGMASGDVVNTAARVQAAAPVNGVLVGERTYRATRDVIDYADAPPVAAKGKEQPVPVWVAEQARARLGVDVPDAARAPLVGRERELGVLRDVLIRVRAERSPQLLTLVGVPGIGKSRLLFELSRMVDAEPDLIAWRQGRSLPYGDGLTFWALAEMVKAQAGVLESDSEEEVDARVTAMVDAAGSDPAESEWLRRHLRGLLTLGGATPSTRADQRDEAFAAWRRLIEAIAEQRPLVLVFEDLHWADDGLLEFIDHLVDWVVDVPLLVVCSARPELLSRRTDWGGGKANATTLSLAPLSDDDTARLIASVLPRPLLAAERQQALLSRAGGNPLFAEQYAQMVAERGGDATLPLPESIQGIIGARLDSLPVADKQLLQDAAVIGKVFWASAVRAVSLRADDPRPVEGVLHALERRQFVRRERRTSVGREPQYAFVHVLLRDVAYAQIPRAARIAKHVRAAQWLESLGRPGDNAEMLAHHYLSAIEIAKASEMDFVDIVAPAREALRAAGDRAQHLNAFFAAVGYFEAALTLWPEEEQEARADLTFRLARARNDAGDDLEGAMLEQACAALHATGSPAAAEAHARLTRVWWLRGDSARALEHLAQALDLVRDAPDSPRKAVVMAEVARHQVVTGAPDIALAAESVALAERFGLEELQANTLITLGTALAVTGSADGMDVIRRGLDLALAKKFATAALRGYSNISFASEMILGDLRTTFGYIQDGYELARRQGSRSALRWATGNMMMMYFQTGDWQRCDELCEDFLTGSATAGRHYFDAHAHGIRAWMRMARGDAAGAAADATAGLERARLTGDPQVVLVVDGMCALVLAEIGRVAEAVAVLDELSAAPLDDLRSTGAALIDALLAADATGQLQRLGPTAAAIGNPWAAVAADYVAGDFAAAVAKLDTIGEPRLTALIRLRVADALVAAGRPAEARAQVDLALPFFRAVGATRFLQRAEDLLPASA